MTASKTPRLCLTLQNPANSIWFIYGDLEAELIRTKWDVFNVSFIYCIGKEVTRLSLPSTGQLSLTLGDQIIKVLPRFFGDHRTEFVFEASRDVTILRDAVYQKIKREQECLES